MFKNGNRAKLVALLEKLAKDKTNVVVLPQIVSNTKWEK